jgi:hypothetical protein
MVVLQHIGIAVVAQCIGVAWKRGLKWEGIMSRPDSGNLL